MAKETTATWAARGWLAKPATQRVFGLGERAIDKLLPELPATAVGRCGHRVIVDAQAVYQAMLARHRPEPPDDPLLAGADSPALERYRAAKASLSEIELKTRRGELIPDTVFRQWVAAIEGRLRMAGERLQRQCGDAAVAVLSDAMTAMEGDLRDITRAAG